jgi:hypothetical protein
MSGYEKQVTAIGRRNNAEIRSTDSQGAEIISSKVAGSRLHETIYNSLDERTDEGGPL